MLTHLSATSKYAAGGEASGFLTSDASPFLHVDLTDSSSGDLLVDDD